MRLDLAKYVIEGALRMDVRSARHQFEPAGNPGPKDIENAVTALNAHVALTVGEGRTIADEGLTLGHLPMLLEGAGIISPQR